MTLSLLRKRCFNLSYLELIDTYIDTYPFPTSLRTLVLRNCEIDSDLFYYRDKPIYVELVKLIETTISEKDMSYLYQHCIGVIKVN